MNFKVVNLSPPPQLLLLQWYAGILNCGTLFLSEVLSFKDFWKSRLYERKQISTLLFIVNILTGYVNNIVSAAF